jgi:hypothetical protein
MGSIESRDVTSIFKFIFGISFIFIHFAFIVIFKILKQLYCTLTSSLIRNINNKSRVGLQSELVSANKEGECVRQRLRYQNEQLERVKEKFDQEAHDEHKKFRK